MIRAARAAGVLLALAVSAGASADDGFRLFDSTAASVNGEVIFVSDLEREACFYRCGAFPGDDPAPMASGQARDKLIADTLVLQEQKKLGLGVLDNAAVADAVVGTQSRLTACTDPCARAVGADAAREFAARRLIVREFLAKRISVFVEVSDDDVETEIHRRETRDGVPRGDLSPEKVRRDLFLEKADREIRNWYERTASKSRIVLSPLEDR